MNILLYSMSSYFEWESGISNRNRNIAKYLEQDDRVEKILMVNFLPFSYKRKLREYLYSKIFKKDENTVKKGLFYKLNKISDKFFVLSAVFESEIEKALKYLDFNNDFIVWSYNPLNTNFLNYKNNIKVFDTVDNWSKQIVYSNFKDKLENNYKEIEQKADVIFTVSSDLLNLFPNHNNKHWIRNGVDYQHFSNKNIEVKNYELDSIKKPILGYVGVIQERLDFELIEKLLQKYPEYSFVFIGPVWDNPLSIKTKGESLNKVSQTVELLKQNYKNIYFLGKKSYSISPKYIQDFDVGIIPHKISEFTKTMDPLKIYEYMACKLPVVTTAVAGSQDFKDVIGVCHDFDEFSLNIDKSLQNKSDIITNYDTIIREHTWKNRVNKMLSIIK